MDLLGKKAVLSLGALSLSISSTHNNWFWS